MLLLSVKEISFQVYFFEVVVCSLSTRKHRGALIMQCQRDVLRTA